MTDQVGTHITDQVRRLLAALAHAGLVERTQPDSPHSPTQ